MSPESLRPDEPCAAQDPLAVTPEAAGRYRPGAEIGRGGIGRVLLALDGHLGREVAVKELLPEHALPAGSGEGTAPGGPTRATLRLLREARVTGQLEHPSIVPVYELGRRADGGLYYTMRVVRGRTLGAALGQARGLPGRLKLLKHFVDLCHAIAYAHSRGVVHRDIKPDNVMLGEFGETVVLDWGLAKVRGQADPRGRELRREVELLQEGTGSQTVAGTAVGTPAYMSPEQAEGDLERVDERADVWSLGAVLYQVLTGRPPFEGRNAFEVLGKVMRGAPRPVAALAPGAPPELAAVCAKALARDREARYPGAGELAREVEAYLTGGRVQAHDYGLGELLARFARRHRGPLGVAALAALLLAALAVASYREVVSERNRALEAEGEARARLADSLREGARAAWLSQALPEARAHLRSSLQLADSLHSRGLWRALQASPLAWRQDLGSRVWSQAFAPDGRTLAVGTEDGLVHLVDVATARADVLRGYGPQVLAVAYAPGGRLLAAGVNGGPVHLWDLEAGTRTLFEDHHEGVKDLVWSPDGRLLAAGSWEGRVRVYEAPGGRELGAREGLAPWTAGLAFSPDGASLWVGQAGGGVRAFSPDLSAEQAPLPTGPLSALALRPDGGLLATAGEGGELALWRLPERTRATSLAGQGSEIKALAFGADGRTLAVGEGPRAFLLEVDSGRELAALEAGIGDVESLAAAPRGGLLAVGGRRLALWRPGPRERAGGHRRTIVALDFSPDGARLATSGADHAVRVWDVARGEPLAGLELGADGGVAWSPDGRHLATTHGGARLWGADDLRLARRLEGGRDESVALAFGPRGRRLLLAHERSVLLVDVAKNRVLARLPVESEVLAYHLDATRALVATQHGSGQIAVHDLARPGRAPTRLAGHRGWIWQLAFDPAGRRLASAGDDGSARVWELATGRAVRELAHGDAVRAVEFHPREDRLLTAANDFCVRLWDLASGRELARHLTRTSPEVARLSRDGRQVAVSQRNGLWLLSAEDLRPVWRGPLLALEDGEPVRLTHRGWEGRPPAASAACLQALGQARLVRPTPGGDRYCVLDDAPAAALWAPGEDAPRWRRSLRFAGELAAVPGGCALLDVDPDSGQGEAVLLLEDGEPRPLAARANAVAWTGETLWVAAGRRLLTFDAVGHPRGERALDLGRAVRAAEGSRDGGRHPPERLLSALVRVGPWLVVGERRGQLHRLPLEEGSREAPLQLGDSFSGRVELLAAGPGGTLLAGYSSGELGLWELASGQRVEQHQLHGPVTHAVGAGARMFLQTELGDTLELDLGPYQRGWCELLAEVWGEAPAEWQAGRAVPCPPPAGHACAR